MSADLIRQNFRKNLPTIIAVLGDSTTEGFGANGADNWDSNSPNYINLSGLISQAQAGNANIPSAVTLLKAYVKQLNPANVVYNYGGSGYTAAAHVSGNTVAAIAARNPKPQICFINLGINSAKNNQLNGGSYQTLINQLVANGIEPVIVIGHNIGTYPNTWSPMPFWQNIRAELKNFSLTNDLDVIDLGSDEGLVIQSDMQDPYHPSAAGYKKIFEKYMKYIRISNYSINGVIGAPLRLSDGALITEESLQ